MKSIPLKTVIDTLAAYKRWAEVILSSKLGSIRKKRSTANRHLALLAWAFPPTMKGGVYRPAALANYGTELGWRLSVISAPVNQTAKQSDSYLLQTLPRDLRIKRVVLPNLTPSWNWFPRVDGGFLNALAIFSAAKAAFRDDPPSVVMATGPPFHTFVSAYYMARFYRSKLILDYRDEWNECPFRFVQIGNMDRIWEERCLRTADSVLFTTESQLNHQAASFPELDVSKCFVIPNGWDPSDFLAAEQVPPSTPRKESVILLSHIGTLGSNNHPRDFLESLEQVLNNRKDLRDRLKLQFVGKVTYDAPEVLASFKYQEVLDIIDYHVPKPQAIRKMQESSGLLLLNDKSFRRYLPGRLCEYLAAGSPILVFGETGEVKDVIAALGAGPVVPSGDPHALERTLDAIADGTYSNRPRYKIDQWLRLHTRERMARKMVKIFDRLVPSA